MRKAIARLLHYDKLVARQQHQIELLKENYRNTREILSAHKFNDASRGCLWYKHQDITPGGWAVDYGFLYTLYRTLNLMRPHRIVEFGLGTSSKLIYQYAQFYNIQAVTFEHDDQWAEVVLKEVDGRYPINIALTELIPQQVNGYQSLSYKNISSIVGEEPVDLVVVDGPFGQNHFSRPNALLMAEHHINPTHFCIIIDDSERLGEQETIAKISTLLQSKGISFCSTTYTSSKDHTLICSNDLHFLTSM